MDLVGKCGVEVTIGLVQTAYANGASTDYIQNVLVSVNDFMVSIIRFSLPSFSISRKYLLPQRLRVSNTCTTKQLISMLAFILKPTDTAPLYSVTKHESQFTQHPKTLSMSERRIDDSNRILILQIFFQ